MKKLFLFAMLALLVQVKSYAQGHEVWVENETDCDIYFNLIASCQDGDCIEYSPFTMFHVPPGGTLHWTEAQIPWLSGPPPCPDWRWYKAEVDIFCNDDVYYYVFGGNNIYTPCPVPPRSAIHYPTGECCGSTLPIKMNLFHHVNGVTLSIRY